MSRVWMITGSSGGLGRALAEAALLAGHRVVATARDPTKLAPLAAQHGDRVRTVALDVTDEAAAREAVSLAISAYGRLDVVVNNAGAGLLGAIEDTTPEEFRAQMETNFFGVVNVTRAALPILRRQRAGHLIQVTSIAGRVGPIGRGAYAAAKWAVEGYSEVLAREVSPLGIRVTIVEPGGFRTRFADAQSSVCPSPDYEQTVGAAARFQRSYSGAQPGDPAKAAAAVLSMAMRDDAPLRLLLGSDAVAAADAADRARTESDRAWRPLSVSTDFAAT
jgi:NAD(P)-dependent dehydrogenase (short-subunit alcohol dehydrogenase family)